MLEAETVIEIKKTDCKVAVFLADSPFFLNRRDHILKMLMNADHIFAPDTYWLEQLNVLGINKTTFHLPGYDQSSFNVKKITTEEKNRYSHDIFYLGSTYKNIWGYKRALFLNFLTDFDFRFYGPPDWNIWFDDFPRLKDHFVPLTSRFTEQEVNTVASLNKIYPVDANPGLINGIHIRILECICMGILPVAEYRKDAETIFGNAGVTFIHNYSDTNEIIAGILKNDELRVNTLKKLQDLVNENYTTSKSVEVIFNKIFKM
jgi:hypothetical protein